MDWTPGVIGALIPVVAVGGFFAWMIALTVSKVYAAHRQAGRGATPRADARHEELVAAVGRLQAWREDTVQELQQIRRDIDELSERVDFTERLLAKQRESERLAPPRS